MSRPRSPGSPRSARAHSTGPDRVAKPGRSAGSGAARLAIVSTGVRVPGGLLSPPAWARLHGAVEIVLSAGHPALASLVDAALPVTALPPGSASLADLVLTLCGAAAAGPVAYLPAPDEERLGELAAALADAGVATELVRGSWDPPGSHLLDLVAVMDRLRSPGGCPWDAEQTHRSLAQYVLEETYEVLEAIETDDTAALHEELGDLLLQVVFHARVASEIAEADGGFDIDDVADAITAKLVRRHPHVFAGEEPGDATHTERQWDAIKRAEKGRTSALDGVPMAQPALSLAAKLMGRVERSGIDVPVGEIDAQGEVGELLLQVVAHARTTGVEPEAALREAVRRYADRVRAAETG